MTARGIDFTGMAYLAALAALGYGLYRLVQAGPDVAKKVGDAVTSALTAINPASPDNLAYQGANAVTRAATGDQSGTFGTKLWEFFHPDTVKLESQLFTGAVSTAAADAAALLARADATAQWLAGDQDDAELGQAMRDAATGAVLTGGGAYLGRARARP